MYRSDGVLLSESILIGRKSFLISYYTLFHDVSVMNLKITVIRMKNIVRCHLITISSCDSYESFNVNLNIVYGYSYKYLQLLTRSIQLGKDVSFTFDQLFVSGQFKDYAF